MAVSVLSLRESGWIQPLPIPSFFRQTLRKKKKIAKIEKRTILWTIVQPSIRVVLNMTVQILADPWCLHVNHPTAHGSDSEAFLPPSRAAAICRIAAASRWPMPGVELGSGVGRGSGLFWKKGRFIIGWHPSFRKKDFICSFGGSEGFRGMFCGWQKRC